MYSEVGCCYNWTKWKQMSRSSGRGVWSAALCLPGIWFRRRSHVVFHPRRIRNNRAGTMSGISSRRRRQESPFFTGVLAPQQVATVRSSDTGRLEITSERPTGTKQFPDKCKSSGCRCTGDRRHRRAKPVRCQGNCNRKRFSSQV